MMTINSDNTISLDGENTGLRVTQRRDGTVVYSTNHRGTNYREYAMPHARYALSGDPLPGSASAGRTQFESDLRALIASL